MDLSRFQDAAGNWLDADAWPTVRAQVTCHTAGCKAEGVTQTIDLPDNVDGIHRVECGQCGTTPEVHEAPDARP